MDHDLKTADRIVRITLAVFIVVLYLVKEIEGPFAHALFLLAVAMLVLAGIRAIVNR